jgi:hypothetical protein
LCFKNRPGIVTILIHPIYAEFFHLLTFPTRSTLTPIFTIFNAESRSPLRRNSSIRLGAVDLATSADSISQVFEDGDGVLPANASISDADTTLETSRTLSGDLLVTLTNVGLDHDTDNSLLTLTELLTNNLGNLGLVSVVLGRVSYYKLKLRTSKGYTQTYRGSSQS